MIVENDTWIMQGLSAKDPDCILTAEDMEAYIIKVGFLPLFANDIPDFSVEEHTASENWWSGDPEKDPWEWRITITGRGNVVYGKFFDSKAGFISRAWLPAFANYRRDGYDFDARWDDELASIRQKKIMDLFTGANEDNELLSPEIKVQAGFTKGGEKNFEGTLTRLEMMTYLVCRDFQQKVNKKGESYGWHIAVLCTPEHVFGGELVSAEYSRDPKESLESILHQIKNEFPASDDERIMKMIGIAQDRPKKKKTDLPYPQNLLRAVDKDTDPFSWTQDQINGLYVALGQLRPKLQRVARMKYVEGLSNEAIGLKMNRSAGTVSSYVRKVSERLRDPLTANWYLRGYKANLTACAAGRHWPEISYVPGDEISSGDLCIRIGLKVKHFEAMAGRGIVTIDDLSRAVQNPDWYRGITGVGKMTADDTVNKLRQFWPA